jgi:hypothetical protein
VRWVRDASGRLPERPHFDPGEIDREIESRVAAFLRRRYGAVRFPIPTDDLAVLVEQEASDLDLYADLSADQAEGMTEFLPGARPRVRIARELSEDPAREHRLRTTLAHELGHVWLHAFLWSRPGAHSTELAPPRCLRSTIVGAPIGDWLEWQAGYACGAVLMPFDALQEIVRQERAAHAFAVTPGTAAGVDLLGRVQRTFGVSHQAARVRLGQRGLFGSLKSRRPSGRSPRRSAYRAPLLGAR